PLFTLPIPLGGIGAWLLKLIHQSAHLLAEEIVDFQRYMRAHGKLVVDGGGRIACSTSGPRKRIRMVLIKPELFPSALSIVSTPPARGTDIFKTFKSFTGFTCPWCTSPSKPKLLCPK
ncbi:hypothetical protein DRQ12_10340, partial [candidate division KSB1 bacterium]